MAVKLEKCSLIKVAESEEGPAIEIPIELTGFILMRNLTSQFPGASGLKLVSCYFLTLNKKKTSILST